MYSHARTHVHEKGKISAIECDSITRTAVGNKRNEGERNKAADAKEKNGLEIRADRAVRYRGCALIN